MVLRRHHFRINAVKLFICPRESVVYLGHLMTKTGIRPVRSKVEALQKLQLPTTCRLLRRAVSMYAYYRIFLPRFSQLTKRLYARMRGEGKEKITLSPEEGSDFLKLKHSLIHITDLHQLDPAKDVYIATDASKYYYSGICRSAVQRSGEG